MILDLLSRITIEPGIFLFFLGEGFIQGAQINTDLLIWKLCTKDLNFTQDICNNLHLEVNDNYEIQVQRKLQEFELINQYIYTVPQFLCAIFSGPISDKLGRRKPLLLLPMFGGLLDICLNIINYRQVSNCEIVTV